MTSPQELKVSERDTTLTPRQLRTAGFVPCTIYGKNVPSYSIQVRTHEFSLLCLQGHREFKLAGLANEVVVRLQQMQVDPVSQKPLSVEFLQLSPQGTETGKAEASKPAAKKATASKPAKKAVKAEKASEEVSETVLSGA